MLLLLLPLSLLVMFAVPSQDTDLCRAIAKTDVASVIGPDANDGQSPLPGSCSWNAKGINLLTTRMRLSQAGEAAMILEARSAGAGKDETVKDEPGLGQKASSSLAGNKRTLTLMVADGQTLWTFTLSKGDQPIDANETLPKLRDFAKKALAVR